MYPTIYIGTTLTIARISRSSLIYTRIIADFIGYGTRIQYWVNGNENGTYFGVVGKKTIAGYGRLYYHVNEEDMTLDVYITNTFPGDYCVSEHINSYRDYQPAMIWNGNIDIVDSLPVGAIELNEI